MFLFFNFISLSAEGGSGDAIFNQGVSHFMKGNLDDAAKCFEDVLKMEPANDKAKIMLTKTLTEKAKKHIEREETQQSIKYLNQARKLNPENKMVKELVAKIEEADKEQKQKKIEELKMQKEMDKYSAPVVQESAKIDNSKVITGMMDSFQKQQTEMLKSIAPQNIIEQILKTTEADKNERREFVEMLKKKDNQVYTIIAIAVIPAILIILLVFYMMRMHAKNQKELIESREEKIIQLVSAMTEVQKMAIAGPGGTTGMQQMAIENKVNHALPDNHNSAASNEKPLTRQEVIAMLENNNSRVRAKGIEVIEASYIEVDKDDKERLVSKHLDDPDNRVRANAVKAMFSINKDLSMEKLREMAESQDKWMRTSCAWVLGEIPNSECADILIYLSNDSEKKVLENVLKSLKKLYEKQDSDFSDDLRNRLNYAIKETGSKLG